MVAASQRLGSGASLEGDAPLIQIAGRYRIDAVLGRGGAGAVYRVFDELRGVPVALKRLSIMPGTRTGELHRLQFRREFHTLATLTHPRIIQVYDFGFDSAGPYYTMELLEGRDLRDLAPVDPAAACRLLRDVASALAFLHARRLIHRDVGPRNVRTTAHGEAKLMDFGLLATMGVFGEAVGTAPCIAPETLRGQPVDGRADLFGLGALAYWLLTGMHAYPARNLVEVAEMWCSPPPPPSSHAPGISPRLDALVLSLLSRDPRGRPASAAEVIERLNAIGGLEGSKATECAVSAIASAAMVGREPEVARARRLLDRAIDGPGVSVVVEAPSGFGKTRFLRELALEAKLSGFAVAWASGELARETPYGLLRAVASALLEVARERALKAAVRHASFLLRVFPELTGLVPEEARPTREKEPREDRVELQGRLVQWFLEVSGDVPLAIFVDDVQRGDEASLAVLASLARLASAHRMSVAFGLRTNEPMRAPTPLNALLDRAIRIPLSGLDVSAIEELLRAAFGDVPHAARFARAVNEVVGGSPLFATELFHHLVARGSIRHVEGAWVLPDALDPEDMPGGLIAAMDQRIARLSSSALALGQALCLHGRETPLELCVQLADVADETAVFAALEELVGEGVLLDDRHTVRFRHDGIREAMRRTLDPGRERALHRRIGHALLEREGEHDRDAEVGWHLLRGGEVRAGADLLARAGIALFESRSFFDAVGPLEAAVSAYEELGVSPAVCLELRHRLVMLGFFSDRRLSQKYGDSTLALMRKATGLELADALGARLGPHLAFVVGFGVALLRWLFTRPHRRAAFPTRLLADYVTGLAFTMSVASLSFDYAWLDRLARGLAPLRIFRKNMLAGACILSENMRLLVLGRHQRIKSSVKWFLSSMAGVSVPDTLRRAAEGGARLMRAVVLARDGRPEALADRERMGRLGLSIWDIGMVQLRVAYHLWRGESVLARQALEEAELLFMQLGSSWQLELWTLAASASASAETRDVLGLRQSIESLTRLGKTGIKVDVHLELAKGEYHRERGELDESRACFERCLSLLPPGEGLSRAWALPALAETYLAAGEYARAAELARAGRDYCLEPERLGFGSYALRAERALALAEAGLGDLEGARRRIARALEIASEIANPLTSGMLHEVAAELAQRARDENEFRSHAAKVAEYFLPTENPVLIARWKYLSEHGFSDPAEARTDVNERAARPVPDPAEPPTEITVSAQPD